MNKVIVTAAVIVMAASAAQRDWLNFSIAGATTALILWWKPSWRRDTDAR